MYTKAIDLKEFYDSLAGRVVQRLLRQHLRRLWPSLRNQRVVGVGYATPFLRPLAAEAERVIALMPAQQGAVFWPSDEKGQVAIMDDGAWPLETASVDRILVVHGVQGYESLDAVLRESWRVLTGQGSLILVVPNRAGLWARFDNTPFGYGTPYSMGQIRHILKDYMFVPEKSDRALFMPPTSSRLLLAAAPVFENMGRRFFNAFGGVNIIEATKQLYAGTPVGATAGADMRRRFMTVPRPLSRLGNKKEMT